LALPGWRNDRFSQVEVDEPARRSALRDDEWTVELEPGFQTIGNIERKLPPIAQANSRAIPNVLFCAYLGAYPLVVIRQHLRTAHEVGGSAIAEWQQIDGARRVVVDIDRACGASLQLDSGKNHDDFGCIIDRCLGERESQKTAIERNGRWLSVIAAVVSSQDE